MSGRYHEVDENAVLEGYNFGVDNQRYGKAVVPTSSDVREGVVFGYGGEDETGTATLGGGGSGSGINGSDILSMP